MKHEYVLYASYYKGADENVKFVSLNILFDLLVLTTLICVQLLLCMAASFDKHAAASLAATSRHFVIVFAIL